MAQPQTKTAIITGAARGIGAAAARALAARGMNIVLAVRDTGNAADVAADIAKCGVRSHIVQCDVSDASAVTHLTSEALHNFGSVDVLVNNAGILDPIASVGDSRPDVWARNIQVNLIGAYHCVQAVLPHMLAQGGGTIINLSSGAAHKPMEGWSAYCAAKAGLAMLTQSIALEYAERGIRVFGFAPGTTDTDMQGLIRASGVNPISKIKQSDLVPVDEPALGIAYLCSTAADDLAGKEMSLNEPVLRQRIGIRTL